MLRQQICDIAVVAGIDPFDVSIVHRGEFVEGFICLVIA